MAKPIKTTDKSFPAFTTPASVTACSFCHQSDCLHPVAPRLLRCDFCGYLASAAPLNHHSSHPHSNSWPLQPGTILRDRYRLVRVIGDGAHGVTYLAHHEFLNHPCVVKVLPHRVVHDSDAAVRRMRGEASAGYRVHHTHVVRVLDGDVWNGIWYFVMEFVDGVDLGEIVSRNLIVDWRQAVQFAVDAANGLQAIHREGLVHRDIKPGNLILGLDGGIRVTDLGVARLLHKEQNSEFNPENLRAGTLAYAAPEMFSHEIQIGPQADLYSLGVTLYEILTGSLPRGSSVYRTLLGPERGSVHWPENAPTEVPQWFVDAILKLLQETPQDRFESADKFVKCLEKPSTSISWREKKSSPETPRLPGVIVLPFENASGSDADDWLGHALAAHLGRSLSRVAPVYVADLDQFLPTLERIKQREIQPRSAQLLEAGRLSGADYVIEGTVARENDLLSLAVCVHTKEQASPALIANLSGPLSTLSDLETELLRHILTLLKLPTDADISAAPPRAANTLAAEEKFFAAKRSFLHGDYQTGRRLAEEALEIDPRYGDAYGFAGACCTRMGLYEQAVDYSRRQERLAVEQQDERFLVQARANLGSMHYFRGEYGLAYDCLAQALQIAEKLNLTTEPAQIRNNLGFVLLQLGRQDEAGEAFSRAIDTLKKYGVLVALVGPYNGMGHVLREQKRYDQARQYFRRALALAQESDDAVNMGVAYMNLGHCALLQGRLADAKHELAVAYNILEQSSFWNGLARVFEYMADLNLQLANCEEAMRCADRRLELASRHANTHMAAAAWRQKAEALRLAGRVEEAEECLRRAATGTEAVREPSAAGPKEQPQRGK